MTPVCSLSSVSLVLPSMAGPVTILRDVSLHISAGETVAILGPSGSGKSSMMALMTGMEQASAGTVALLGQSLARLDEDALARARRGHIGIVLQAFHLIPTMSALENVAVPLELCGAPDAFARAAQALERVGLAHRHAHYPAQLSGGEQQRVAIARAMAPGPRILFADEPTGNLDGATGSRIIDLLFALHRQERATLVLITHDPALARRCGRIVEMRDGAIVADRSVEPEPTAA